MPVSNLEFIEMQRRCARGRHQPEPSTGGARREADLHNEIIAFCRSQIPAWKFVRCRMDVPSSIDIGAQDFTIFASRGRTFCVECKSANGKLTREQAGWQMEMERSGHKVHVVRSMAEFLEVVK